MSETAPEREPSEKANWWPVVLGCGGLLLLAVLALFTFTFFVANKPAP